jgi:hypothetical protein
MDDDDDFDSDEQAKKNDEDQSFIILADLNQIRALAQKNKTSHINTTITADPQNSTNSTVPAEDTPPNSKDIQLDGLGRDSHGHFRNHKHFLQLQEKINEQESKHQPMFESIMRKLSDKNFLEQALQTTEEPEDTP